MKCPFATWKGPVPGKSSGVERPARGLVLHVMQGTLEGTDAWFHNPQSGVSAHFGVGVNGELYQWVDTTEKAWAQGNGNTSWYSVETEGYLSDPLTDAQIGTCGVLLEWLQAMDHFAMQVTDDVNGEGLIIHSAGGSAWGGHSCPGDIRASQRPSIIAAATGQSSEGEIDVKMSDVVGWISVGPDAFYRLSRDGGVEVVDGSGRPKDNVAFRNYYVLGSDETVYDFGPDKNGGVFSYPGLPANARKGDRYFVAIGLR